MPLPSPLKRPVAWLVLLLGLVAVFHPVIASGFERLPGGLRDARLVHFTLEHSYRFLEQRAPDQSFWDPPLFFPARNVAAYTDVLVSFAPLYWPWRWLGLSPEAALLAWWVAVFVLNFLIFYLLLARHAGTGTLACAAGAYLFAFGSPRLSNYGHPQLMPGFLLALGLLALFEVYADLSRADGERRPRRRSAWIIVFCLCLALQAWGAFYPFYFAALLLALALPWALGKRQMRHRTVLLVRRTWPALLAGTGLAALLLAPLAQHYLQVFETAGPRSWDNVAPGLLRWQSWVLMGKTNKLYGALPESKLLPKETHSRRGAHRNGFGLATTLLVAAGLIGARRRPVVQLFLGAFGLAIVLATVWPGGFTFWRYVAHLPGAGAIRAVGRIGQLFLIPAGFGLAFLVDRLATHRLLWSRRFAFGVLLLVAVEQLHTVGTYGIEIARWRTTSVARHVTPICEAFYVSGSGRRRHFRGLHEDAMWAAFTTGVPTINGRYGNKPPRWRFTKLTHRKRRDTDTDLRRFLLRWADLHQLDRTKICWIDLSGQERDATVRTLAEIDVSAATQRQP